MIKGLDQRVDIIFEPDAETFLLTVPYGSAAKDFLTCYGMAGVNRERLPGFKAWRINTRDYNDIIELLFQYFPKEDCARCQ